MSIIKHTETENTKAESHSAQRIAAIIFGVVEISLVFRLIFKLLGANPLNGFVKGLYAITQLFVGFFEGIFSRVTTSGLETIAVFEPATVIAMVVIALIAWVVLKLTKPRRATHVKSTVQTETEHDEQPK